jgi:hypothetical protein
MTEIFAGKNSVDGDNINYRTKVKVDQSMGVYGNFGGKKLAYQPHHLFSTKLVPHHFFTNTVFPIYFSLSEHWITSLNPVGIDSSVSRTFSVQFFES